MNSQMENYMSFIVAASRSISRGRQRSVIKRIELSHFINRETGEAADKRAGSRGRSVRFEGNSIDRPGTDFSPESRVATSHQTRIANSNDATTRSTRWLCFTLPSISSILSHTQCGCNPFGPRCMIYFGFCTVRIEIVCSF